MFNCRILSSISIFSPSILLDKQRGIDYYYFEYQTFNFKCLKKKEKCYDNENIRYRFLCAGTDCDKR